MEISADNRQTILILLRMAKDRCEELDSYILNDDKTPYKDILLSWQCLNTYVSLMGNKIKGPSNV